MRGAGTRAVAQPASAARTHPLRRLPDLLVAGAVASAAVALFGGGGTGADTLVWVGTLSVLAAVAAAAGVALGLVRAASPGAGGFALLGLLAAYAVWSGITIAWSVAPDRSWESVNRGLAYVALLGLGMLAGALVRSPPRAAAAALAGLLGVVVLWSLAGRVVPALGPDVERNARLVGPLEYWNALALAVAISVPLWLWLASAREHAPFVRAGAAAALVWAAVALLLTGSRGGLVVAGAAAAVWLALAPTRLESAAALALALPVGGAVGVWALTRPGISETGAAASERARDGAALGLLLVAGAAAVLAAALALLRGEESHPLDPRRRRSLGRTALVAAAVLLTVGAFAAVVRAGGPAGIAADFRNPPDAEVANDPSRYLDAGSNHRWRWWSDAWEIFSRHRVGGTGAGSYELARRPMREDARAPADPHSLPLKAASETGAVGLLLVLGAVAAAAAVVVGALRRLPAPERAAAAALAAAAAAWLAHSLFDMTWQLAAVTGPLLLALGVLSVSGRPTQRIARRRPLAAVAAAALAVPVVFSLASPRLAESRRDAALDAIVAGRLGTAIERAREAQELNPLAVEPLHLEAAAYEALGRHDAAEALYVRAAELQPRNAVTWYELGRFRYEARDDPHTALLYLDRSWGLDPWARDTGRLLDVVRAELERRAAEAS